MNIKRILNQVAQENTYLISTKDGIIVIDPGSNTDTILQTIKELDKPVVAILLTHTHYDHIMSIEAIRKAYHHPPLYVSQEEAEWLGSPVDNLSGLDRHSDIDDIRVEPAEYLFEKYQTYQLAGLTCRVVPTPGHSFGSVSFIFSEEATVFSGDALFKGNTGRTDLPTGDYDALLSGIRQELFTLPDHYTVYPGHGPSTTIGHEKQTNPYFN